MRDNGYQVLIDGLNPLSFQFFSPNLLEPDYVKVSWSQEFLGDVPKEKTAEIRKHVEETGQNKIVLSRVDSDEAILWGLQVGIRRFQGHYTDVMVEKMKAKGII